MTNDNDLLDRVREVLGGNLKAWDGCEGCEIEEVATPAHAFFTVFRVVGERLIDIGSRDEFDDKLAAFVMENAANLSAAFEPSRQHIEVHRISFPPQYQFDTVVLLGTEGHDQYEYYDSYLNEHTIVAFPAFHCEFAGNETPGEIDYMRRNIVLTLDWDREPSPKCKILYRNHRTGIHLKGDRLLLASVAEVIKQVENLERAPGPASFLDIQNFQDTKAHLEWSSGGFQIKVEDGQTLKGLSLDETKSWVSQFLYQECQRYITSES